MRLEPRVLIVEDEPIVAADLTDQLVDEGFDRVGPTGASAAAMPTTGHASSEKPRYAVHDEGSFGMQHDPRLILSARAGL
jgi:hypothetical protein